MSVKPRNERLIAYKKLVGKTHTSSQKGAPGEQIASNVQINTKEIFANAPIYDQDPANLKFCQKITFSLSPVVGSEYVASTAGTEAQGESNISQLNADHGFALLQGNDKSLQTDPKKQLVPPSFGVNFKAKVFDSSGNQLADDGDQDWSIDYYSGVLFMQDMGGVVPATAEAYLYTGRYISDLLVETDPQNDVIRAVVDEMDVGELLVSPLPGQPGAFSNLTTPPLVRIGGNTGITGDLEIEGTLHTKQLIVEQTTEVVEKMQYSGEAIFGNADSLDNESYKDDFKFYGDIEVFGNLSVTGDTPSKKKVATLKRKDINLETFFISDTTRIIDADSNVEARPGVVELKKSSVFLIEDPSDSSAYSTNDEILVNITLPDLVDSNAVVIPEMNNVEYVFKRLTDTSTTYSVKINSYGAESTIDGESSISLNVKYETVTILSNNGNWHIL